MDGELLFSGSAPGSLLFALWYWDGFFWLCIWITPLRTLVLRLSKERDEIYVDAKVGFYKKNIWAARHPADFDGCPTAGA